MKKCLPKHLQKDPADMAIKIFVLGNPGGGKSTLVKSIQTEAESFASRIKHQLTKVKGVDEKTAGIIPYDIHSKTLGHITMFDFAGHREYYAGHDALLRNSVTHSPSVIILVVDIRDEEHKIKGTVEYWLEFLTQLGQEGSPELHLLVTGSHVDKIPSNDVKTKLEFLQSHMNNCNLENLVCMEPVMLDCRYAESSSMSKLRSILSKCCQGLRVSEDMEFSNHCFLVFLLHKFDNQPAITLNTAMSKIREASENEEYWTFMKSLDLLSICEQLNKRGNILLLRNCKSPENSWIILDKDILLTKINGTIFAPEGFKEHKNVATSTGVVPVSKLASIFCDVDTDMITEFLCHMEFCHEITDPSLLSQLQADRSSSPQDKFLFFPGLVNLDTPRDLWQPNGDLGYHSGWLLKCFKSEQFFSPRFLQVLLLRLTFGFALAPADPPDISCPVLLRNCSIWKNGISWANRFGVEAIVEVIDQKLIVVMTRCLQSNEMDSIFLRSSLIRMVLDTKREFCRNVAAREYLVHPDDAIHYPVNPTKVTTVNMTEVAKTVSEGGTCIVKSNTLLKLEKLLHFEPYADLNGNILQELFDKRNHHKEIKSELFYHIAEHAHSKTKDFVTLFKTSTLKLDNLMVHAPPGNVHKLVRVFQLWRDGRGSEGTYSNFHKKLSEFSVFAGRNPLLMAAGKFINKSINTIHA